MREFQFESTTKSSRTNNECFNEDDIINIYPIIKQVPPKVKLKFICLMIINYFFFI